MNGLMKSMLVLKRTGIIVCIIVALSVFAQGTVYAKNTIYNTKNLISKIENDNVYLYYDKKSDGMLKGFYLKSGNKVKYFEWENIDKASFYPSMTIMNNQYIAIICTTAEGTGVNIKKLYIINQKNLEVLSFDNPLDVVKANAVFEIQPPSVSIKINHKTWTDTYNEITTENFFNTVSYENIILYDIQNTYFKVRLSAQISPATFIGDFEITYYFNDQKATFIPLAINFNFYPSEIK
jgi:hypothetical protein